MNHQQAQATSNNSDTPQTPIRPTLAPVVASNDVVSPPVNVPKRKHLYSLHDKVKLVKEFNQSGMSGRKFAASKSIHEKSLRQWKNTIDLSLSYDKSKKTMHPGRKSVGEHIENALCVFIDDLRSTNDDRCSLIPIRARVFGPV